MIVTSKEIILAAQKGHYAIGAFNASNLETLKAIIAAAEVKQSPIIIATTESSLAYAGFPYLVALAKEMINLSKIPIALHLDHGKTLEMVKKCLEVGYTSIMIDGSHLNLEKNINLTKSAVELSHKKNIPIEGEVGTLDKDQIKLTNPLEVKEFVSKSDVDFIAVGIGSQHGIQPKEKIDIDLVSSIRQEVDIPLVLHGASGVPDSQIAMAIKKGICKINIDTEIRLAFINGFVEGYNQNPQTQDHRKILNYSIKAMQKVVEEKIELFGSSGRI